MTTNKLSIIVIAGNEEKVIADCIKSCLFAEDLILVAANSTDKTKEVARKICPRLKIIITNDEYNKNFSKWRNLGLKQSTHEWVLYVDSDERVTPVLKDEIASILAQPNLKYGYYVIPRENYYLNKRVRFGGSYPDYVKRLFNKQFFKGFTGYLHEEPDVKGAFGFLKAPLIHLTHRNLSSMIQKTLAWTQMESEALFQAKHPPIVWWRIIRMMITKLWQRLIIEQMWRDGTVGWISSIFEMFDTFIIYARLWELQQSQNKTLKSK